jgi:hypothetical protein
MHGYYRNLDLRLTMVNFLFDIGKEGVRGWFITHDVEEHQNGQEKKVYKISLW